MRFVSRAAEILTPGELRGGGAARFAAFFDYDAVAMTIPVLASHILFAIALFCVSVAATYLVVRLGILDEPNHRSSHVRPTPSTGGSY